MRQLRAPVGLPRILARLAIILFATALPVVTATAQPLVEIMPSPIEVAGVTVDSCASRRVVVRNLTADTIIVDSIGIVAADPSPFALVHPALPAIIPGLQEMELNIVFCPRDTLRRTGTLELRMRNRGGSVDTSVSVGGIGILLPPPQFVPSIDVDPAIIEFDSVEAGSCVERVLRITNRGTGVLSIATSYILPSGAPFEMLDTAGTGGVLAELAMTIAPDSTRRVRIRFCPDAVGTHVAIDTIISNAVEGHVRVVLRGVGIATRPIWSGPRRHEFGPIDVGSSSDATLAFVNISSAPRPVTQVAVDAAAVAHGFEVLGTSPQIGAAVLPGDSLLIAVRFSPRSPTAVSDTIVAQSQSSAPIEIVLSGSGRTSSEGHSIALDSAGGRVGEPLELRVLITPPLTAVDDVHGATIRLAMDPRSFQPLASPGWSIEERTSGAVTYVRTAIGAIVGETVATLRLRPLSTARSVDTVALDSIDLAVGGLDIAVPRATIVLEGCDLGRDLGLSRPLSVRSMSRTDRGASISIEYRAPTGSTPTLAVFDRSGAILERLTLPSGTGESQRHELALDRCPPGMLIVELTVGRQRFAVPIMHRP